MSPRKARRLPPGERGRPRRGPAAAPRRETGRWAWLPRVEEWPDGDWVVRQVPGEAAAKVYRCPGCDQEIAVGTAHVVVWPADGPGPQDRRHWHASCWQRRPRRPAGPRPGRR